MRDGELSSRVGQVMIAGARTLLWGVVGVALMAGACSTPPPPPEPTTTPTPVPTPSPSPTPAPTPEPSPTPTPEPPDVLFRYTYAVRLLQSGQYDEAVPQFDIVIRFLPDFAQAYHGRGLAHYNAERIEEALTDFSNAIELDPDYADAYRNRGMLYANLGDIQKSITDLRIAMLLYQEAGQLEGFEDIRRQLFGLGEP